MESACSYFEDRAFQPQKGLLWPALETLLRFSAEEWTASIRDTPLKRAKVRGLLRNLMVVAGNSGLKNLIPQLQRFLDHEDEHVRSHVGVGDSQARKAQLARKSDGKVCVDTTALILSNCRKELPFLHGLPHRRLDVNDSRCPHS